MIRRRFIILAGLAVAALLTACGGGGGGGGGTSQPTTATLILSSVGPVDTAISSADVTITLPAGVTVKTDAAGAVSDGVAVASGKSVGALNPVASYTPATATAAAKVRVLIIDGSNFTVGEFLTVHCDVAAGSFPQPTDFSAVFTKDANGADMVYDGATFSPIPGMSLSLATDIR